MTRPLVAAALLLGVVSVAGADDAERKREAQGKVSTAKTEVCEKGKKFLEAQKAKGRCTAEADEASKITCSASTSKQVTDLVTRCTKPPPADKPAAKS